MRRTGKTESEFPAISQADRFTGAWVAQTLCGHRLIEGILSQLTRPSPIPAKELDHIRVCCLIINVRSDAMGRGLLLWLLGIPIPVIILLYVFHVI